MELSNSRVVRTTELAERLGISRITLWRWEREGRIPRKRKIGPNVVGWLASEIDAWWASQCQDDAEEQ